MARPRKDIKIYARTLADGSIVYYGDFRALGGRKEALKPPQSKRPTSDPDVARIVHDERVKELLAKKHSKERQEVGIEKKPGTPLGKFAEHHLVEKLKSGRFVDRWLGQAERHLEEAVSFFGATRVLDSIGADHMRAYVDHLRALSNGRGAKLTPGSQRKYLNSLSNLYRRAASEDAVPPGFNPVAALMDKPVAARGEASWLEVHDAALLLESARLFAPPASTSTVPGPRTLPPGMLHAIVATMLLTGGRKSEVLGLEVGDVNFTRRAVTFRPNTHRRLKTLTSFRTIPFWPQLEEILREYIRSSAQAGGLLFPSPRTGKLIVDFEKSLDLVAARAGWKKGEVRCKAFRHTYCSARLQTLDQGAPVSVFTVARELGHGGDSLVKRIYGHLGEVRQRSGVVEFRVDQHVGTSREYAERVRVLRSA